MPSAKDIARNSPGFFKVDDIKGDELQLLIRDVVVEEVGQDRDQKQVMIFDGTPRKLVLNKTRTDELVEFYGNTEVRGQAVILYVDTRNVGGRNHEMVLFRPADAAE